MSSGLNVTLIEEERFFLENSSHSAAASLKQGLRWSSWTISNLWVL